MSDTEPVSRDSQAQVPLPVAPREQLRVRREVQDLDRHLVLLMSVSIGALFVNRSVRGSYMNWTIDFKGGTEIIFAFKDKAKPRRFDQGRHRQGPRGAREGREEGIEVSDIVVGGRDQDRARRRHDRPLAAVLGVKPEDEKKAQADFVAKFKDRDLGKANWSGDRLYVRSKKLITPRGSRTDLRGRRSRAQGMAPRRGEPVHARR